MAASPPPVTPSAWAVSVLQRLNIPPSSGAVQAMTGWARAEGGNWHNDAKYNPLNTTEPMPGAGNTGSQGNIKVYKSWNQGIDATVKTLRNGRYNGILAALKAGNPSQVASAIGQTPWGTSASLVKSAILGTPAPKNVQGIDSALTSGSGFGSASSEASSPAVSDPTTSFDQSAYDDARGRAVVGQWLAKQNPNSLLITSGAFTTQMPTRDQFTKAATPATVDTTLTVPSSLAPTTSGRVGTGKVVVAGGANRAGVSLQKPLLAFLNQLSVASHRAVDVTTGTNHNQYVAGEPGVQSDHWTGNASDLGVGGDARTDQAAGHKGDLIAAHAIQTAAGIPFAAALEVAQKGGVHNYETPRGRVQIIWRSMTGGNHFNHVHVGVKPA